MYHFYLLFIDVPIPKQNMCASTIVVIEWTVIQERTHKLFLTILTALYLTRECSPNLRTCMKPGLERPPLSY